MEMAQAYNHQLWSRKPSRWVSCRFRLLWPPWDWPRKYPLDEDEDEDEDEE